ncbi:MAG: hypothetical protein RR998_08460 [Oscillospiraceae bacterium]
MAAGSYQEAYRYYISYYRTATIEQLAGLKERTQRAAAEFKDRPQIQEFAAGKVAAIDALVAKMAPKREATAEQQHF